MLSENISWRITEAARLHPEKRSVVFSRPRGRGFDYPSYTFREFEERSNQMANRLFRLGVTRGTRTLLFVRPCLDFSVLTFALFKLGAIPVLIDPGMGTKNLLASIAQVKPEALVSIGLVHWIRRFRRRSFKTIRIKISLDAVGGNTHHIYDGLHLESQSFEAVDCTKDDPAAILFTSGGTGIPKGVIYTHGILNAQTEILQKMFRLDETQVDLPGFPLFALFTLAMGMTSVIPDMDPTRPAACDPKKIVQNILDQGASFVAGSPAIWERVGRYCLEKNIQLGPVKQVVMFGAPVRWEIHEMFRRVLPFGDTFTPYGATECLPVTLISGREVLELHRPAMMMGKGTCVGKAVLNTRICIIPVSDIPVHKLDCMAPNLIGEICVSGPQVTQAYFEMEEETRSAKVEVDGTLWHRMGDVGCIDSLGNLWFLGRKSHRVETPQQSYFPLQIEAIFNQHPEIRRSALIKLERDEKISPALVIERWDKSVHATERFVQAITELAHSNRLTVDVTEVYLHPEFPTDVRHNIKIDRSRLSRWAKTKGTAVCLSYPSTASIASSTSRS